MRRKVMVLVLVALAALMVSAPALAAGSGRGSGRANQERSGGQPAALPGRGNFALVGIITAKDSGALIVMVYGGNRLAQPYIGQELAVQVTDDTRYRQWTADGCTPITYDEVQAGDTTSMRGIVSDEVWTAKRVTVDVPCCTP